MAADLEARIRELEAKVQVLNDREALRLLRYRYHEYINEAQFAKIVDLFTDDGELEFGPLGKAKGREPIMAFFKKLGPSSSSPSGAGRGPHFSFVKQYIHNHVVEVHGDRATGFSYLEAKPIINGEAYIVAGRYDDEYRRVDGQWLFTRMNFTIHIAVPHKEGWAGEERVRLGPRS
ncbi:MAG TPA: nuclear transport factor 2 family protein [Candidatus Binataceae bacterium]|nr:nuclear transport factor 2 family protein [Candidatus Binataceae bacterium]